MPRMSPGMTFEDAMHGDFDVTKAEAMAEVKRHQLDAFDLFNELGDHDTYKARAVLEWLGY